MANGWVIQIIRFWRSLWALESGVQSIGSIDSSAAEKGEVVFYGSIINKAWL
jgi:hypothetical protein